MKRLLLTLIVSLSVVFAWGQCTLNISHGDVNCDCNGWAKANVTGTPPFTYTWSNSWNSDSIFFLCPGKYYVTVSDYFGCIKEDSVTIGGSPPLYLGMDSLEFPTCIGLCNGEIKVSVVSGTPPYHFEWFPSLPDTNIVTGLCDGTYNYIVTDAGGCSAMREVSLFAQPIWVNYNTTSMPSCFAPDGDLKAMASGTYPPFTYLWSTGATTDSIGGIAMGVYSITVTDANGCSTTDHYALNSYDSPMLWINSTEPSCFGGNDGWAQVNASGMSPFTYSWSHGQTTDTANNITAGFYIVTVTDMKCEGYAFLDLMQPDSIYVEHFNLINPSCNGLSNGMLELFVNGGTPNAQSPYYWFDWSTSSDTLSMIDTLNAGIYSVTITDLNGCILTKTYTITDPAPLVITNASTTDVSCFGYNNGSVTIFASGGTPPLYYSVDSINFNDLSNSIIGLSAGTYRTIVKDENYCIFESTPVQVFEPPLLVTSLTYTDATCAGNDGSAIVSATGGTSAYTYSWTNLMTNDTVTGLTPGTYGVTVTDINGCTESQTAFILQGSNPAILSGFAYWSGGAIDANSAEVMLLMEINSASTVAEYDTLATVVYGASGYTFNNLLPGNYITKFNILPGFHPTLLNTYHDTATVWMEASVINLQCDDDTTINTQMYEMTTSSGNGSISGYITMFNWSTMKTTGPRNRAVGEPVPGAEILVEQEPTDLPIQATQSNDTGYYEINGLPVGTGYFLVVDIPGFPLITTYDDIDITASDTLMENMNFWVDTTNNGGIIADTSAFNVPTTDILTVAAVVYPNPFSEQLNISFNVEETSPVSVWIIDMNGRKTRIYHEEALPAGSYLKQWSPDNDVSGQYVLQLSIGNNVFIKKLEYIK
jgi:hypothetical protein